MRDKPKTPGIFGIYQDSPFFHLFDDLTRRQRRVIG
jgi:hypothetical protein